MKRWLLSWLLPEEVYVVFTGTGIPVSTHTTEQGATEDTGSHGYVLGGIKLVVD